MSRAVPRPAGGPELVTTGADACELVEHLYLRVFGVTLWCVLAACALCSAYAVAPPRDLHGGLTPAVCALVALAAGAALLRPEDAYRALRRRALGQWAPGLLGAGLLLICPDGPLWFVALSLLAVTAIVGTARQTLAVAAVAGAAHVAGTALAGADLLAEAPMYPVTALALVLDAFLIRAVSGPLAGFVMPLHASAAAAVAEAPEQGSARHVRPGEAAAPAAAARAAPELPQGRGAAALTPRQLEVVLLLRDGLQQSEVAEALSISRRQVGRHVADARRRTGARTTAELVARVVRDGLAPAPRPFPAAPAP